jgi:predicted nucleic acid-binding protein
MVIDASVAIKCVELPILLPSAMRIAGELGHSIYDCFYLAAALLRDTTLVAADRRLLAKAAGHPYLASRAIMLGN